MSGVGDFCFVFRPGGQSFALKSVPGVRISKKKISGPGGVTGQIDTCIIWLRRKASALFRILGITSEYPYTRQ